MVRRNHVIMRSIDGSCNHFYCQHCNINWPMPLEREDKLQRWSPVPCAHITEAIQRLMARMQELKDKCQSERTQPPNHPPVNDVVKALFKCFCGDCEAGAEDACLQPVEQHLAAVCPVFEPLRVIDPTNRFVLRIAGKYMSCPNCNHMGTTPVDDGGRPSMVCTNCGATVWQVPPIEEFKGVVIGHGNRDQA